MCLWGNICWGTKWGGAGQYIWGINRGTDAAGEAGVEGGSG